MTGQLPPVSPRHELFNQARREIVDNITTWAKAANQDVNGRVAALFVCQQWVMRRRLGLQPNEYARAAAAAETEDLTNLVDGWQKSADLTDLEILAIIGDEAELLVWQLIRAERTPPPAGG